LASRSEVTQVIDVKTYLNRLDFSKIDKRLLVYLSIALVAQVLFWYFSMPGPQILSDTEPDLGSAAIYCAISFVCLFLLPLMVVLISKDSLTRFGLGVGDFKFGLAAVAVVAPVFVVATAIGSGDQAMQGFYPIAGTEIGSSVGQMLLWIGCYGAFYLSFEFFYRGFLLKGPERLGLVNCFMLQLICCVMIHFGKPFAETLASIPASILFAGITIRARSIWYAFAIHFAVGIANDLAILWQRDALSLW
jgi:hypothetical protein